MSLPYGLSLGSLLKTGDHWVLRLRAVLAPLTLADTDFVAWALRVAPECRNLHLHMLVGALAIVFIMLSPAAECCGLVEPS